MPEEDSTNEREDDVEIDDDEIEEATIDTDEDVTVEETLEVDDDGVEEEVSITEDGEERASIEEDIPVDIESEGERTPLAGTRERIEEEADRAVEGFDERVVDMLSWVLDTETRARIYVHLRQHPYSTSEEVAEGTGLYPSTVREALAELHDEGRLERRKRESEGAGNNPYEYTAIAPSELVGSIVGQVQDELNAVFNLDRRLGRGSEGELKTETEPVSIRVEEESDERTEGASSEGTDEDDGREFGED